MGKVKIKLCGVTSADDYRLACSLGINFVGFVFVPSSPRCVAPEEVLEITGGKATGSPVKVGVFADQSPEDIGRICRVAGLEIAQLHGVESPGFCRSLGISFWKAVTDPVMINEYGAPVLLDASGVNRNGEQLNLDLARRAIYSGRKVILAGGISSSNVIDFISLNPWGIDFSSSVESSPGVKDSRKVVEITEMVRRSGNAKA